MFNMLQLYRDYKINMGPHHHKHTRRGWINIRCPFCTGNVGYHLGYNIKVNYFRCYRCGWHPIEKVLRSITNVAGKDNQKKVLKKYWIDSPADERDDTVYADEVVWPLGLGKMDRAHHLYLMDRGFPSRQIEREWGLMGTNHLDPDYKFRVIAPINFKRNVISFQGRDITNVQSEKYKACAKEKEVMHHKHTLYGLDEARWDACLVVEGITGVWRFGAGTVGTFGAQYKRSQLRLLSTRYSRVFLLFDDDEAGRIAQDSMDCELSVLGCDTILLNLDGGDSGEVPQNIANSFMDEEIRK